MPDDDNFTYKRAIKMRKLNRKHIMSESSGSDSDIDNETVHNLSVDQYCLHDTRSSLVLPSRAFCARVAEIVQSHDLSTLRLAQEVKKIIDMQESWLKVRVDVNVVDAALYYTTCVIDYSLNPKWIRVFWASEERWVTARVDKIIRPQSSNPCLYLHFPCENVDGTICGSDSLYAYELK